MSKPILEIVEQGEFYKVYYLHQDLSGLSLYERTKAIERFINNATKTLEIAISSDLRHYLREYGIIPQDGSESALQRAFLELEQKGKVVAIIDRYYKLNDEHIIAESPNHMTVILESENFLGCSMEVRLEDAN